MPRLSPNHCQRCARIFDASVGTTAWCGNCKNPPPAFDFATAAFEANASTLNLIHQFKLLKHPELARDLAAIAAPSFQNEKRLQALVNPLLIPTPLHRSRLAERRFNQSDLLANFLSKTLEIPLCKALKRTRRTPRQATMRRKERLENVKNAFQLRVSPETLASRDLVLIDDVLTTGSTAHACAKALRVAKPRKIVVFTIVRA